MGRSGERRRRRGAEMVREEGAVCSVWTNASFSQVVVSSSRVVTTLRESGRCKRNISGDMPSKSLSSLFVEGGAGRRVSPSGRRRSRSSTCGTCPADGASRSMAFAGGGPRGLAKCRISGTAGPRADHSASSSSSGTGHTCRGLGGTSVGVLKTILPRASEAPSIVALLCCPTKAETFVGRLRQGFGARRFSHTPEIHPIKQNRKVSGFRNNLRYRSPFGRALSYRRLPKRRPGIQSRISELSEAITHVHQIKLPKHQPAGATTSPSSLLAASHTIGSSTYSPLARAPSSRAARTARASSSTNVPTWAHEIPASGWSCQKAAQSEALRAPWRGLSASCHCPRAARRPARTGGVLCPR